MACVGFQFIGDIKELRLTEGRGTGFPIIYNAMEANGSPAPVFSTDEQTYVLVTLPVHHLVIGQVNTSTDVHVNNKVNDLIINKLHDIIALQFKE